MHLFIVVWALLAAWKWADWSKWKEFLPSMYFMATANLFYQYLGHQLHHLWQYQKCFINEIVTDNLYTFIVFPCTVMLYLSNYPKTLSSQVYRNVKWICIYLFLELIGYYFGFITYQGGWSFYWSCLLVCTIFPMLRLHHVKPLWALGVAPFIIAVLLIIHY